MFCKYTYEDLTDFEGFGTAEQIMNRIVIELITKEQLLPSIEFLFQVKALRLFSFIV